MQGKEKKGGRDWLCREIPYSEERKSLNKSVLRL